MTDNYDIALAALIHDIGKIESRSGVTVEDSMVQQVETIWGKLGTTVEYNALKSQSEKLISTASMLSAGIDSDEDLKDRASDANKRLYSIFQDINIGKQYKGGNYYYKLVPLTISDDIFPIRFSSLNPSSSWQGYLLNCRMPRLRLNVCCQ